MHGSFDGNSIINLKLILWHKTKNININLQLIMRVWIIQMKPDIQCSNKNNLSKTCMHHIGMRSSNII